MHCRTLIPIVVNPSQNTEILMLPNAPYNNHRYMLSNLNFDHFHLKKRSLKKKKILRTITSKPQNYYNCNVKPIGKTKFLTFCYIHIHQQQVIEPVMGQC